MFDGRNASLAIVSTDADDESLRRLTPAARRALHLGLRPGGQPAVRRGAGDDAACRRFWLVLDPMLRVLLVAPLEHAGAVMAFMAGLPPSRPARRGGVSGPGAGGAARSNLGSASI